MYNMVTSTLKLVSCFITVFLFVVLPVYGEMFTSTDKVEALITLEKDLLEMVKTYIDDEAKSDRHLEEKWIKEYESLKVLNQADANKDNFTENPLNSYHILYRTTKRWQTFVEFIICEECEPWQTVNAQGIKDFYQSAKSNHRWPKDEDCTGAALALVRLSEVYLLDLFELIEGRIYDSYTNVLTDEEVLHIVKTAEEKGLSYECLKWLDAGLTRALKQGNQTSPIKFYKYKASIYFAESIPWKSLEITEEALKKFPNDKRLLRSLDFFKSKTEQIPLDERDKQIERKPMTDKLKPKYEALCNGRTAYNQKGLCQYKKTRIPIYFLKEEILSIDPRISMFYDVIKEKDIQYIKRLSMEKLYRSSVLEQARLGSIRISQSAWLEDRYPEILKLSNRVELMTGLSLKFRNYSSHAEILQVLNYGVGGMYEPHFDFFNNGYHAMPGEHITLANSGDRLATFLFYLNDVKAGGSTVFPRVNVRVPVIKGAAAFWFNLKRSTEIDERTEHAGCPVLLGSKWVCNKWIRLNGNMFNAKCGLRPNSKYSINNWAEG